MVHLKGLTNLRSLELTETRVSDAGMVHLKGLARLQGLDLSGTDVTDAGLRHLKGLIRLQYLSLAWTKVTNAGVQDLWEALPEAVIYETYGSRGPTNRLLPPQSSEIR
jgi:hypothetical protein